MERENKFHFLTCTNVIYQTEFIVYLLSKHCVFVSHQQGRHFLLVPLRTNQKGRMVAMRIFPHSAKFSSLCVDFIITFLYCRIESYSCKLAGHEKQLYKRFHSEAGAGPHDLQVLSAPQTALAVSPTGGYFTNNQRCVELGTL